MSYRCENCGKGKTHGHAVSHAKVRLLRAFRPNLQKLPVLKSGRKTVAKLCASCIKRLKKDGHTGVYSLWTKIKKEEKSVRDMMKKVITPPKPEKKGKETKKEETKAQFDIASIVGKKA